MKTSIFKITMLLILSVIIAGCQRLPPPTVLDFDHPRLQQLAKFKPIEIEEVDRLRWDKSTGFQATRDTSSNHGTFIAMVVSHYRLQESYRMQSLLLFRRFNDKTTLIWESQPEWRISLGPKDSIYHQGFADRNLNNLPDLAFEVSFGGNTHGSLVILEFTRAGRVRDITPRSHLQASDTKDIDGDGMFEVIAFREYQSDFGSEAHAGSPIESRIYEWQGNAYKDASAKFAGYFDAKIAESIKRILASYDQPFLSGTVSPLLAQTFFDYEATKRTKEGWSQVLSLGDLDNWVYIKDAHPDEIAKYRRVLDRLRKRVH